MPERRLDPILFAVIKARVDGIVNEMTEVLLRTSRNPILYAAKDFTCAMFSYDARLLTMTNSIAVHIYGNRNSVRAIAAFFKDDLHPGDVFVNNSPYHGANHYGDVSMATPIFNEGEVVGWAGNLCHLIDCGAHVPTNLDPYAKDIYEAGLHFPPTRLVREYREIPDLINLIKANFRYPEQWHGDFLAQVGSLKRGAQELTKLCQKYGNAVMKQFQDDFIAYGDQRMTEEIKKMPRGTWSIEDISERWVAGGGNGALADHWIENHASGEKVRQLRNFGYFEAGPDEDWVAITNGGGGYGDPLERDPELVRDDARNYFISLEAARNVYGVVLDTNAEALRCRLRSHGKAS